MQPPPDQGLAGVYNGPRKQCRDSLGHDEQPKDVARMIGASTKVEIVSLHKASSMLTCTSYFHLGTGV